MEQQQQQQEMQQQPSASQGYMNDTHEAEQIDAANQRDYDMQEDDNMQVEPFEEPAEASDDSGGFFSLKTILIVVAILFILLAIWYFFIRASPAAPEVDFPDEL